MPPFSATVPTITMPPAGDAMPVYVARRVLKNMARAAQQYPADETGEALIGFAWTQGKTPPRIYLLETIAPGQDAIREWAMFEQGSAWQDDVFQWYHENWELYRHLRRASYGNAVAGKWDTPLRYLGDWHKQPGIVQPSRGDFRTAKRFMKAQQLDYMLTPIVTFADEVIDEAEQNTVLLDDDATSGPAIRIDFWMIYPAGSRFERVQPVLVENEDLPRLPPLPWNLANEERFMQELDMLEADGIQVLDIVQRNPRQHPPLDTCLLLHREGAQSVVIAVTAASYPWRQPAWRVAPILRPRGDEDFFELLYRVSKPVENVLPDWKHAHYLLDGVRALEEKQHT